MKRTSLAVLFTTLLLPLSGVSYDQNILDGYQCVQELNEVVDGLKIEHSVFGIEDCLDSEINRDLNFYLNEQSGYEPEWFKRGRSSVASAVKLLLTDHSSMDGSAAYSADEVMTFLDFLTAWGATEESGQIQQGEYADSYMSGTGVTSLVFVLNQEKTKLVMIEKFSYAE